MRQYFLHSFVDTNDLGIPAADRSGLGAVAAPIPFGIPGFNAVRMIAVSEREIAPGVEQAAIACRTELAIQLSMLRRVAAPASG